MVWICKSCGHGNLDIFTKCIQCNDVRKSDVDEPVSCWDFLECKEDNRDNCIVFNTDNGSDCFKFQEVLRKCNGHKNKSCNECEWYKELRQRS